MAGRPCHLGPAPALIVMTYRSAKKSDSLVASRASAYRSDGPFPEVTDSCTAGTLRRSGRTISADDGMFRPSAAGPSKTNVTEVRGCPAEDSNLVLDDHVATTDRREEVRPARRRCQRSISLPIQLVLTRFGDDTKSPNGRTWQQRNIRTRIHE